MKICWCEMCGYTATVPPEHVAKIEEQADCPDCEKAGDFSLLAIGDELPEGIAADDPMPVYKPRKRKSK